MSRSQHAVLVPCPRCNRQRGQDCRTPTGRPTGTHEARVAVWRELGCPGPAQMPKGEATPKSPQRRRRAASYQEARRERHARRRQREAREQLNAARGELGRMGL